jgi:hypothetical protein
MHQWWHENQHMSLREMQIAALRWAIERERKIGFPTEVEKKYYLDPLLDKLNDLSQE